MVDTEAAPADAAEDTESEDTETAGRDEDTQRRSAGGEGGGLSAARAGRLGLQQIAELTGKAPEGVTGVEPTEDGWVVSVEVVEDRRVPSSTDILATYEADIDAAGNLVSYRRVRRYSRGHGENGGAS
ncbi:MAG: gas vesicle protein [Streptosporangiaceae bacterium]|nr:gas vesicle protein [Streptosporangiaceae bacterium]MBV9857514.1 gas vesicle protein [Streptosporangiaceae bacterium]